LTERNIALVVGAAVAAIVGAVAFDFGREIARSRPPQVIIFLQGPAK
jgi:hypothetical protein